MRALAANVLLLWAMSSAAVSLAALLFFLWRAWCSWLLGKAEEDRRQIDRGWPAPSDSSVVVFPAKRRS